MITINILTVTFILFYKQKKKFTHIKEKKKKASLNSLSSKSEYNLQSILSLFNSKTDFTVKL